MKKLTSLCLALTALFLLTAEATPARPTLTRILFLYGSVPPGTGPGEMIRIGNAGANGYAQLATLLHDEQGHNLVEVQDTDPSVNPLTLNELMPYDLIVLGSNNRRYSKAEAGVLAAFVNTGGAVLALSDSQFGPSPDRGTNAYGAGELSDNDLIGQFGMAIQHDNYQVVEVHTDRFANPNHPILAGITTFKGEGVSLIRVDGPPAQVLVRGNGLLLTDGVTVTGMNYAITAIARHGRGKVAATFDRNTFFNADVGSAGTHLGEWDNRQYARNLFRWLTTRELPPPGTVGAPRCE